MCGRFGLTSPHEAVVELFEVEPDQGLIGRGPRYNICPTQEVETARLGANGREMARMRWGFIPEWYKAPSAGPLIINARSETVATKPAFAESIRFRRCLIATSGFYEWQVVAGGGKRPYWVRPADEGPIAFAGLWREWVGADGQHITTCAIVTTAANQTLAPIHHRLPLALKPERWALWLGEEGKGASRLMTPPPEDFWAFHEVDAAVNYAKSDGPGLMTPAAETRLL